MMSLNLKLIHNMDSDVPWPHRKVTTSKTHIEKSCQDLVFKREMCKTGKINITSLSDDYKKPISHAFKCTH